jgi:cytochrome oxidase Cu insertion factor (SCO1/SenC/PrrC family)
MKPALKTALKITAGALAIVVVVGGAGVYLNLQLKADPNELALGTATPRVDLVDSEGKPFSLPTLTKTGLPVLVFYRGHW